MIRILHILPGNMNMGGIESYLMNIYRNIDRKKVQFDFVVHSKDENYYEKEINKLGGVIYRLPIKANNVKNYEKELTNLLKNHKEYNTVHIHATYSFSYIEAKVCKSCNIKNVIFHSHNKNAILKRKIYHYLFKHKISNYTTYNIACSFDAAKWMYKKNIIKNNLFSIWNNTINSSNFSYNKDARLKIRRKYNIGEDTLVIGNVGRISYQKNPEKLINIFNEIHKQNPSSVLFMIGEGELKEKINKKIKLLGLEKNVFLIGNVDNVNEYLSAFDIFLFPTRYEGLGIVLIEAQASGLKCFTSDKVVPKETNITTLINYINLNSSNKFWAKKVLENINYKRKNMNSEIKKSNFDNSSIKNIEKFYIEIN